MVGIWTMWHWAGCKQGLNKVHKSRDRSATTLLLHIFSSPNSKQGSYLFSKMAGWQHGSLYLINILLWMTWVMECDIWDLGASEVGFRALEAGLQAWTRQDFPASKWWTTIMLKRNTSTILYWGNYQGVHDLTDKQDFSHSSTTINIERTRKNYCGSQGHSDLLLENGEAELHPQRCELKNQWRILQRDVIRQRLLTS
jgi:hypothetical protein